MITREEYMKDSSNLHHAYYLQHSEPFKKSLESWIIGYWPIETIKKCLEADEHLNNLPHPIGFSRGHRISSVKAWMECMDGAITWTKHYIARVNKQTTGQSVYSMSDNVCMIKARMKEMVKESTK